MRTAVVGHVEWVTFAPVARVPLAGEIVHAQGWFEQAAGGGSVAAVQLARLAGGCEFLTALGDDEPGRRSRAQLAAQDVTLQVAAAAAGTRRAFTFLDDAGERTITALGERVVPRRADPLPWEGLAGVDAIYFTGGDAGALRAARAARVLVATVRARDAFEGSGVVLDVLVRSGNDVHEAIEASTLDPPPRIEVITDGAHGGTWRGPDGAQGTWDAVALPGDVVDAYGCGDCFAAALTYGLAAHDGRIEDALALAARAGATCLTGRGPYGAMIAGA